MKAASLLAEITQAFQGELYPGDLNIVVNNAPDYDLESLKIRNTFMVHTWQALPTSLLQYEQGGFNFLSKPGLRYYLPAYLQFCVRDFKMADSIPDNLIYDLTIPAEIDVLVAALDASYYQEQGLGSSWYATYQKRLHYLNQDAHRFMDRYGQFSPAQSRAILHFLEYLRDEHREDYLHNEPAVAIERYWFQFA